MLAPQTQTPSVIDSLSGNMEDWYNAVDASIKKSDVIPGNYEYTVNTSYGNVGDINEGSSTHFDVSCDRFKVVSLENSYITMRHHVVMDLPQVHNANDANGNFQNDIEYYYIGFKSAFDSIAQYRLYSNSDHVQTQNHANFEWFMIYNSISDEAKENSDCFATFNKINHMSPFVPGCYVKLPSGGAAANAEIEFDIKIPLSSFLTLYNLRYFPHWAGKLTIEVYPSYKNLVICPVLGNRLNEKPSYHYTAANNPNPARWEPTNITARYESDYASFANTYFGFININQHVTGNNYSLNGANNIIQNGISSLQFTSNGDGCLVKDCKIRLATYLLKIDLANALAAKYMNVPLIFPIQTTQIKDFTNPLAGNTNSFTTANTIALKHCDAMFLVFRTLNGRTCFNNPLLSTFRVNVDGKFYPREELKTFNDRRFINLTLDALNINNNLLTSINKDLSTSLQPFVTYYDQENDTNVNKWIIGDYSNFMIGIPFCDSDDFMGGISTVGTVQIELSGQRENIDLGKVYNVTAICFEDCYLKIRSVKPDGRPQIEITNATIEQMALGGL